MKNIILSLSFLFVFSFSALAAGPGDVLDKAKEDIESLNKFALSIHNKAAAYRQKLNDLDELKKSVLKKAFDGEL